MKTYTPIHIGIDNEDSDEGFLSLGFVFNYHPTQPPHNLGICRDKFESPGSIYFEADDQIHGFSTTRARFSINGSILELELLDQNVFYWDGSKAIHIELLIEHAAAVNECLIGIFSVENTGDAPKS